MTIFYILLYYVWRIRYDIKEKQNVTIAVYGLSVLRIVLCLFPQNQWLSASAPLSWGIYRNIPFALLGLLIIVLFYKSAKETKDTKFQLYVADDCIKLWLLHSGSAFGPWLFRMLGMLMIPKTCAYVWTILLDIEPMKSDFKK